VYVARLLKSLPYSIVVHVQLYVRDHLQSTQSVSACSVYDRLWYLDILKLQTPVITVLQVSCSWTMDVGNMPPVPRLDSQQQKICNEMHSKYGRHGDWNIAVFTLHLHKKKFSFPSASDTDNA